METETRISEDEKKLWTDESQLAYHTRQFDRPYRSTVHLDTFLSRLSLRGGEALDVACGAGANIMYLSRSLRGFRWTGLDLAGDMLFPVAREHFAEAGLDVSLVTGDLFDLDQALGGRSYDLVMLLQTLSWLPDHERALAQLLGATKPGGWLVLSALFAEADVDTECLVYDHAVVPELPPYHINVYSLRRIRAFCEMHGCREFRAQPFDIDIDLPRPDSGGLGTFTQTMQSGRRMQFTGPVYLPWMFVAARMGE